MGEQAASPVGQERLDSVDALADNDYIQALRQQMLKFAVLHLSDAHAAEDAVQEALVGALKNAKSFAGRAALKTWVFAILKNKIADSLRKRNRMLEADSLGASEDSGDLLETLFNQRGFWHTQERPVQWGDPEGSFQQGEFWTIFELCLEHLPANQARVFMMREYIELDTNEICASLDVSVSNVHVMLHRARLRLRECLEDHWYAKGT